MTENLIKDLNLSFQRHDELMQERLGQPLDDLGDLDRKIIKLEDYIYITLSRHPELQESYDTSGFLTEADYLFLSV